MTREDLLTWEQRIEDLLVDRRRLGGFDTNAAAILEILNGLHEVLRHLREHSKGGK